MSAPEHANPSARPGARARGGPRSLPRRSDTAALPARTGVSRLSAPAWGAIAATVAFVAVTCWWLTQDRSIPIYDAGDQLETALLYHNMLQAGNLLGPFTYDNIYPILGHVVGAVAALIGGVSVASPIIGENVVFIPLLALGCYQTGRLLFGRLAGMMAVVFVLGSPLLISMFHVFLLDGPLTAMVALSVWLILASEDFSRPGVAGLAGLAVGLGVNVKVQFALFLGGLVVIVLLHGGWRNWRGFAVFAVVALVVGLPWYIAHSSELGEMFELASSGGGTPAGNIPPTLSSANYTWYFWSVLNSQLLAPLAVLAAGGMLWMLVTLVRDRGTPGARLEFFAGGFVAWVVITFPDSHHDIRYGMPLLGYLAVVATGWITRLPRTARLATIALLILGVAANTLGIDFGVGREVKVTLVRSPPATEQLPDRIILFTTTGFLASAPSRDGDVPGLLEAMRSEGVRTVMWSAEQSALPDFSAAGLVPLAQIARLAPAITRSLEYSESASVATLVHESVHARAAPTCTRLSDGTGVWVVRYDTAARKLAFYCPTRRPRFYDPEAVGSPAG
ncbi:MAG TPA: glycosyltransferase family 39 protein [Solirubrobacteraceae bacterium]|nr:glycosyltransferase family 39 protein [Solirubrobacteraceae bacterium]